MTMPTLHRLAALAAASVLILTACGSDGEEPVTTPAAPVTEDAENTPAPEPSDEPEPEPEAEAPEPAEGEATAPGTQINLGDTAVVRYSTEWSGGEAPEEQLIEISIARTEEATIDDIPSNWALDEEADPNDVTVLYVWHTYQRVGEQTHDIGFYNISDGYEATETLGTYLLRDSFHDECVDVTPAEEGFNEGELVESCMVAIYFGEPDFAIKWNQFESPYKDPYGENGTNSIVWNIF